MRKIVMFTGFLAVLLVSCGNDKTTEPEGNRAPAVPSAPSPANGANDQPLSLTLSWQCSDPDGDSLSFDIYFGLTQSPPLVQSDHGFMSFQPGALQSDSTYYWRIVAKDSLRETNGPTWSFSTITVVDFIIRGDIMLGSQASAWDLERNDSYLYSPGDSSLVIDFADPGAMNIIDRFRGNSHLGLDNNTLFGTRNMGHFIDSYNLSDPSMPQVMDSLDTGNGPVNLIAAASHVYLAMFDSFEPANSGLVTVDATDPHNLIIVDTLAITYYYPGRMRLNSGLLLLSQWTGLDIISLVNPNAPQIICSIPATDEIVDATLSNGVLFTAERHAGVQIFDVSALPSYSRIGSIGGGENDSTEYVIVHQQILYIGRGGLLLAYDVSDPSSPALLAQLFITHEPRGQEYITWLDINEYLFVGWLTYGPDRRGFMVLDLLTSR